MDFQTMPIKIRYIILLGFVLRITAALAIGDFTDGYYWEYGEIAKNIVHDKGFSLFYIEDSELLHHFNVNIQPAKSAYMPPGYVYFLIPFMWIGDVALRNVFLYLLHTIISCVSIYLIYLITKKKFNENTALIAALLFAILPEFIYAILSFSPTVIYHFLVLLLLFLSLSLKSVENNYISYALLVALIIYFRSEFVLFFFMIVILLLLRKQLKYSAKIFFIVLVLILPWSIRNYFLFEQVVPLTTSFGLNLYRGNNNEGIGSWGDDEIAAKIGDLKIKNLEIELDKLYSTKAIIFIKEHPIKVIRNGFVKLYYFWVYYPNDRRSLQLIYLIPSLLFLFFFLYGVFSSFKWNEHLFFYMFFIYSTLVAIIFFPMIRYQTMMKVAMVPFCAYGISLVLDYFLFHKK